MVRSSPLNVKMSLIATLPRIGNFLQSKPSPMVQDFCRVLPEKKMFQTPGKPPARALPTASCHLTSPDPATFNKSISVWPEFTNNIRIQIMIFTCQKVLCCSRTQGNSNRRLVIFCEQETELFYGLKFLPKSWGRCSRKLQNCENPAELRKIQDFCLVLQAFAGRLVFAKIQ